VMPVFEAAVAPSGFYRKLSIMLLLSIASGVQAMALSISAQQETDRRLDAISVGMLSGAVR